MYPRFLGRSNFAFACEFVVDRGRRKGGELGLCILLLFTSSLCDRPRFFDRSAW